jgi:hypothetical protein
MINLLIAIGKLLVFVICVTFPIVLYDDLYQRSIIREDKKIKIYGECAELARKAQDTDYHISLESCMERKERGDL